MHAQCRLDEWAAVADDLSNDFASAAHCLREARLSRRPDEPFKAALRYLENACDTFNALADDMRGEQSATPDPLVQALAFAHAEIERLQTIIAPDELSQATLRAIRLALQHATAA